MCATAGFFPTGDALAMSVLLLGTERNFFPQAFPPQGVFNALAAHISPPAKNPYWRGV